jgi:glycosyltransferase involved in cell wall biosynthesis
VIIVKKKDILFVMNNLNCGGAEKALISLLETIDYSKVNVDLFLFKHEGLFMNKIPEKVNLLPEPDNYNYFDMSIKKAIVDCLRLKKLDVLLNRIKAGFVFKTEKNRAYCEQRVWKYISKSTGAINKNYDVSVGFLEKNPIYFIVDKTNALKKIGFIHNDYDKLEMNPKIDSIYFKELSNIVTVSEECASVLKQRFGTKRIEVMYNIVSPKIIHKMSSESSDIKSNYTSIVSVGRLTYQKGFEIAIETCKILVEKGFNIKWYIIGEGEERIKLEQLIKDNKLQNNFILLGIKENPYPFIKDADIYVQPSRFEGKSIAVDEAKILHKPIIVTNFSTAKDQIKNGENGIIVELNSKSLADGIIELISNETLRTMFVENLKKEELGTESEIDKFYKLLA